MTEETQTHFVRIRPAARAHGISARTIYRWAERGLVTLKKRDSMTFVEHGELAAAIAGSPKARKSS